MALLEVSGLEVTFPVRGGELKALRGIDFSLDAGERLGIVGESGAGKSMAAFAILNLISEPGYISAGKVMFEGRDLAGLTFEELRRVRGKRISMIFQDPMMTLNPLFTVGQQMIETLKAHEDISDGEARARSLAMLREVSIPSPEARLNSYPHELSGGLRQRVVIAIALLTNPAIVIADEPTTALDVTIQAEIMALLQDLCVNHGVGLILITHDLAVVSQITQRIMVMYAGRTVEQGPTRDIIRHPRHPYTAGLIKALPQQNAPGTRLNQIPGAMPTLDAVPVGCAFNPRCAFAGERCREALPPLSPLSSQTSDEAGRDVACFRAAEIDASEAGA